MKNVLACEMKLSEGSTKMSGPLEKWGEIESSYNHIMEMVWKLHEDVLVLPLALCTLLFESIYLFFVDKYMHLALVLSVFFKG